MAVIRRYKDRYSLVVYCGDGRHRFGPVMSRDEAEAAQRLVEDAIVLGMTSEQAVEALLGPPSREYAMNAQEALRDIRNLLNMDPEASPRQVVAAVQFALQRLR